MEFKQKNLEKENTILINLTRLTSLYLKFYINNAISC